MTELLARLSLQFIPELSNGTIKKLLQVFGNAADIFKEKTVILKNGKRIQIPEISDTVKRQAEFEAESMERHHINLCFYTDADFPRRLKSCNDSPYMLYYKGENIFSEQKMLAVVGTRNVTPYGKDITKKIIEELAEYNVCIISGLARGVDTVAHEHALENNMKTVAVMGAGLRIIYPDCNERLAQRIEEQGGALVSEFPFKTKPDRQNFPQRNRIIAGMADATVVMETAQKGGSIITAYIAHSYNRDVFAVPGNIFSPTHEGCNALIHKNVAALVTSGAEIAEMMGWDIQPQKNVQKKLFIELTDDEKAITDLINAHPDMMIDELIEQLPQFPPSKLATLLLQLELNGVILCNPGKCYRIN